MGTLHLGISAAAVGVMVLVLFSVRSGSEWLLNMCMRGVLGTLLLFFVNIILEKQGIVSGIGINQISVLTSAILGFPGVLALYGIGLLNIL